MNTLDTHFGDTAAPKAPPISVTITSTAAGEVAGLSTKDIYFEHGTQFAIVAKGPALAEVTLGGHFALMYRRKDSRGLRAGYSGREFYVTDENYETSVMTHAELVAQINRVALQAV